MELLGWLMFAVPFVVAAAFGFALPLMAVLSYRSLSWGLGLMVAAMLADVMLLSAPVVRVGLTLFVADVPMALLAVMAALRWLSRDDMPRRDGAWLALVGVFGLGLVIGLAQHGKAAGVAARGDFYALVAASYAMSFPIGRREMAAGYRAISTAAWMLLLLTLYRWLVFYLPIKQLLPPAGIYNNDGEIRVVWANAALLMAEVAVLGVFYGRPGSGLSLARWLAVPLVACVVVLQHRSVWLAASAGVVVALQLDWRHRASRFQQIGLVIALGAASVLPLLVSERLATQLGGSVQSAVAGQGTVHARLENWQASLQNWAGHGALAVAIGDEPGADKARTVETEEGELRKITYSTHNHFVALLTGSGVLGLVAYLWVVVRVLRGLARRRPEAADTAQAPNDGGALMVLVTMQLVYFVSYGSDFLQFAFFGLALAWAYSRPAAPVFVRATGCPQATALRGRL